MAHFAEIGVNNIVLRVIVVDNKNVGADKSTVGESWCRNKFGGSWKQTSRSDSFRKQFASPNFTYDTDKDIFIAPQPFDSWSLDSDNDWQPPVAYPSDGGNATDDDSKDYQWDESVYKADNSKGWVLVE